MRTVKLSSGVFRFLWVCRPKCHNQAGAHRRTTSLFMLTRNTFPAADDGRKKIELYSKCGATTGSVEVLCFP